MGAIVCELCVEERRTLEIIPEQVIVHVDIYHFYIRTINGRGVMKKVCCSLVLGILLSLLCLPTTYAIGSYGVDLDNSAYTGAENPFTRLGHYGECTWYCWGRAKEKLGVELSWNDGTYLGNAKDWLSYAASSGNYDTGSEARSNSIMVEDWGDGIGHVLFVEKVEDGYAYVTEANYNGLPYHEDRVLLETGAADERTVPLSIIGYIYLESGFKYHIDKCEGDAESVRLAGWVYNEDNAAESIQIHAYLDGEVGSGAQSWIIPADQERNDVDEAMHAGAFHGFDHLITDIAAGQHTLYLYVNDQFLNKSTPIGAYTISVYGQLPIISDVQICDISLDGYTVSCLVEGDVSNVEFPTWTLQDGQDDIIWGQGALVNGRYTYQVEVTDHNGENDCTYVTHIYARETYGGSSSVGNATYPVLEVYVPSAGRGSYIDGYTYPITGTWGDNLSWIISMNGTLTVTGAGQMEEYGLATRPWIGYSGIVKKLIMGSEITSISPAAFCDFANLEKAYIGEHVLSIGDGAFRRCTSLNEVVLPDGILSLGGFTECTGLSTIEIPDSVLSINDSAFYGSGLKSIIIPDSVTSIGDYAFGYCYELEYIVLPKNLSDLRNYIFSFNPLLITAGPVGSGANIEFSWKTSIPGAVFGECTYLTNIEIPDGITTIKSYALADLFRLEDISIPKSLAIIEENAICYPSTPDTETNPFTVHYAGTGDEWEAISVANGNELLHTAIKEIQPDAIPLDEMMTLPAELKEIDKEAFYGADLPSVVVPEGCTSIGQWAFADNPNLKALVPASVQTIGSGAFDYSPNVRLYVYRESEAMKYAQTYGIRFFQIADGE